MRVIELGQLLAGPFTGRLLGDLGAEIIKVEPPGQPDPMRDWGHARYEDHSLWWPVLSRNKKCITLDLRKERGQELLLDLARRSDVVVENFRPGTLERWDLGYERLRSVNEGIILARVSGYGQTGPYASARGSPPSPRRWVACATSTGFPAARRLASESPSATRWPGCSRRRECWRRCTSATRSATGGARWSTPRSSRPCFALLEGTVPEYDRLGIVREPSGTSLKGVAPSNIFKSRDGKWVVIAANQDKVFRRLCEAMGQPELADDARFATHLARGTNQEEIDGLIADWAARARRRARSTGCSTRHTWSCGPIYTIADIFEDPHFKERDMLLEHHDPEFGDVHRAGGRSQAVGDAGRSALVRPPGRRGRTTTRSTASCWGSRTPSGAASRKRGCCERQHLRCRAARRPAERADPPRARRARRRSWTASADAGVTRVEVLRS